MLTYSPEKIINFEEKIVKKYTNSVKIISKQIFNQINYQVSLDDLQQIGFTGLLESIKRQKEKVEQNSNYYELCIKGKILDELRKNDHLTQSDREILNKIEKEKVFLQNNNINANSIEISKKVGVDVSKYYEIQNKNNIHKYSSLEELKEKNELNECMNSNNFDLEKNYQKHEIKKKLINAIKTLNYNEQIVLQLIYYEDCSLAECAEVLEVSKSKAHSIHNSCIEKIQKHLKII